MDGSCTTMWWLLVPQSIRSSLTFLLPPCVPRAHVGVWGAREQVLLLVHGDLLGTRKRDFSPPVEWLCQFINWEVANEVAELNPFFVEEQRFSSERDCGCRKGILTLFPVLWAAASCWAASLPGYTLRRSWDSLGLLSLWLRWARRGGFRITSLPHCSPEGSRQAFWRYLIFACVSFPVCFPLTGAVPLTPDALVQGPFYLLFSHAYYFSLLFSWFSVTLNLSPRLATLALKSLETSVMSLMGWKWPWHLHFPLCLARRWVSH